MRGRGGVAGVDTGSLRGLPWGLTSWCSKVELVGWIPTIAELGVAAGTAWLAWSTRSLVGKTASLAEQTKRDVDAQFVPVVVAGFYEPPTIWNASTSQWRFDGRPQEPLDASIHGVRLKNVGKGAALDVTILSPGFDPDPYISWGWGRRLGKEPHQRVRRGLEYLPRKIRLVYLSASGVPYYTALDLTSVNGADAFIRRASYFGDRPPPNLDNGGSDSP